MADSIKKRTEKGSRKSALSDSVTLIGRAGVDTVSRRAVIQGGQKFLDKQQNEKEQRERQEATRQSSKARGPNSETQSPKKPSQPKRDKKPKSLAERLFGK